MEVKNRGRVLFCQTNGWDGPRKHRQEVVLEGNILRCDLIGEENRVDRKAVMVCALVKNFIPRRRETTFPPCKPVLYSARNGGRKIKLG